MPHWWKHWQRSSLKQSIIPNNHRRSVYKWNCRYQKIPLWKQTGIDFFFFFCLTQTFNHFCSVTRVCAQYGGRMWLNFSHLHVYCCLSLSNQCNCLEGEQQIFYSCVKELIRSSVAVVGPHGFPTSTSIIFITRKQLKYKTRPTAVTDAVGCWLDADRVKATF